MNEDENFGEERREWFRQALKREVVKLERRRSEREKRGPGIPDALFLHQIGESISAAAGSIPSGVKEITLKNVHTGNMETVPMNPKLTAEENAALYLKKARKARKSKSSETAEIETESRLLATLRGAMDGISRLTPSSDAVERAAAIDRAKAALSPIYPDTIFGPRTERAAIRHSPFRHFNVAGCEVFIGKNDEQNDELSTSFAAPSDIWFHVAGSPGSHCVLQRPKGAPPPSEHVLRTVASLAVWFSKLRHAPSAEVHFTEARFVHKEKNSPPGEVVLNRWKSIRVVPEPPERLPEK